MGNLPSVSDFGILRRSTDLADVTFTIKDPGNNGGDVEIKAHKVILAGASEIFKTQFFGAFPSEDIVRVEDATVATFNLFLDSIYNVPVELKELSLKVIGELFYLAEKYRIDAVKKALVKYVREMEITKEEVLPVLTIAESTSHLVEFADALFMLCVKFAHKSTTVELMNLFHEVKVEEKSSIMLHRFLSKAFSVKNEDYCKNCQHHPCLDESVLSKENFVTNAFITRERRVDGIRKTVSFEGEVVTYRKSMETRRVNELKYKCK